MVFRFCYRVQTSEWGRRYRPMIAAMVVDRGQPGKQGGTACHILFVQVLHNSLSFRNKRARPARELPHTPNSLWPTGNRKAWTGVHTACNTTASRGNNRAIHGMPVQVELMWHRCLPSSDVRNMMTEVPFGTKPYYRSLLAPPMLLYRRVTMVWGVVRTVPGGKFRSIDDTTKHPRHQSTRSPTLFAFANFARCGIPPTFLSGN